MDMVLSSWRNGNEKKKQKDAALIINDTPTESLPDVFRG